MGEKAMNAGDGEGSDNGLLPPKGERRMEAIAKYGK